MRVCLLTYGDQLQPGGAEAPGGADGSGHTGGGDAPVPADPRPFLPDAEWTVASLEKATGVATAIGLIRDGHDLYFNFCDGAWDSGAPGIEIVQALERFDVPFTGATSPFYEPSREAMKRVCGAWGIDTPGYVMARDAAAVEHAGESLRFPLIVKHPSSYSSVGMTRDSRVESPDALREQARRTIGRFGGALIEEFIEGGEATVLVAEDPDDPVSPTTFTPIRYEFPPGETFKHYDLKWHDYHGLRASPVDDPDLDRRLRDLSARMFMGLDGAGYGRCDFRIDRDGRPFMLEINPQCGMYYPATDPGSADLCLLHDPAGHDGFTRQVVAAAFARHERRRRGWDVRPTAPGSYGLFATRGFRSGEVVIRFEEEPHTLVSRSHVERCWAEPRLDWFRRYAWPLSDDVWVIWGSDPDDWRPVNHSCDPSAWIAGLDVVARSPIDPGDEITLDYATFTNELMPAFDCACGQPCCRGTITGADHLAPVVDRYGDHVSDYVRRKRNGRRP